MNDQEIEFFIKSDLTWHNLQKHSDHQTIFLIFCGVML